MGSQTHYDTAGISEKDRFGFWHEAVCDSYVRLGCTAENRRNFHGSLKIARHSMLSISHVRGSAHTVRRRHSDIRLTTDSYFLISLQLAQTCVVSQFDQQTQLTPGDMALYSSTEPYELDLSDDFQQIVIQIPKERLLERLPNAELMAARVIDGQSGIGKLVRDNIIAFSAYTNASAPTLRAMVQDTLIDLVATGLASHENCIVELSSPEQHALLRAKSFIRDQLHDSCLDRNLVANHTGLSVRRLNAIFAKEGVSLSSHIRQTRLDAIASDLRDPRFTGLSISQIAIRHGMENLQHLSTCFRRQFQCTPRDYRAHMD